MDCEPTHTPEIDLAALRKKYRQEAEKRRRQEEAVNAARIAQERALTQQIGVSQQAGAAETGALGNLLGAFRSALI